MKLIQAIIEPHYLDAVTDALGAADIFRLTVSEVQGAGHENRSEVVAGSEIELDFVPKLCLEIAVNEDFVELTIEAIQKGAGGGSIGAGKILVFDLEDVVRIRTGERGPDAI